MLKQVGRHGWAVRMSVLLSVIFLLGGVSAAGAARSPSRTTLAFTAPSGAGGANHFLLRRAGRYLQLVDLDTHRVLRQRVFALTTAVSIGGADGAVDNTLTIDFSGGSLAVPGGISFDGGHGGYNTLSLRGGRFAHQRDVVYGPHAGLIDLDATTILYADIAPITDTTPASSFTFNATTAGATINVVDGPIVGVQTTQINGGASSTFELVNFANKAHVTINGVAGSDTFTLDNPNPAHGLESLSLASAEAEHSVFDVFTAAVPLTVVGAGLDTLNLGMGNTQSILSPVNVTDPKDVIALNVDDAADATGRTASITTNGTTDTISGLGPANITAEVVGLSGLIVSGGTGNNAFTFAGAGSAVPATLNTGAGSDTTNVQATSPAAPLTIHGQNGNDAVSIGNVGSVQGIAAAVSVDNVVGATTLTLDDSADATARTVVLSPTTVSGLTPEAITYGNVSNLTLKGGAPSDAFSVTPSTTTSDNLLGGGSASTPAPGNTLTMTLTGANSPALSGTAGSQGAQGAWTFANRSPVNFSGMHTLNPTALSIGDAAATVGGSGSVRLGFAASLLAPSTQTVTASYATADGSAIAASGAYQPAGGTVTFAPGMASQSISVNALGSPTVRTAETFLLNLTSPVGALLTRSTGTGTITDSYLVAPSPTPPIVGSATQSHRTWREGNAAAHLSARAARPPLGTTFSFSLNEPASVTFTFTGPASGRKVGKTCVPQTKKNNKKHRCTRTVIVGTLTFSAHAATNKVRFEGLISKRHKLKPGSYTLLITATASGQHSTPRTLHFTIAKG